MVGSVVSSLSAFCYCLAFEYKLCLYATYNCCLVHLWGKSVRQRDTELEKWHQKYNKRNEKRIFICIPYTIIPYASKTKVWMPRNGIRSSGRFEEREQTWSEKCNASRREIRIHKWSHDTFRLLGLGYRALTQTMLVNGAVLLTHTHSHAHIHSLFTYTTHPRSKVYMHAKKRSFILLHRHEEMGSEKKICKQKKSK